MFPFNDILLLFHGYDIISLAFCVMRQFWSFSLLHTCLFFCLLIWVPSSVAEAFLYWTCRLLMLCSRSRNHKTEKLNYPLRLWEGLFIFELHWVGNWVDYLEGNFWGQYLLVSLLDRSDSVGKNFSLSFLEDPYLAAGLLGVVLGKMARGVCIQQFTRHVAHGIPLFFQGWSKGPEILLFLKQLLPTASYIGTLFHTFFQIFMVLPISDPFELWCKLCTFWTFFAASLGFGFLRDAKAVITHPSDFQLPKFCHCYFLYFPHTSRFRY